MIAGKGFWLCILWAINVFYDYFVKGLFDVHSDPSPGGHMNIMSSHSYITSNYLCPCREIGYPENKMAVIREGKKANSMFPNRGPA